MTHIDTAEMYGSGRVEELVGEAIAGRRHEVFLVTKVLPQNATYQGVQRSCEASLRRLGTDHLDVYLLHGPSRHPLEETIRAFTQLVRDGKTRFWGVSNFDVDDLEEALRIAGPHRIACNQVVYHLKERTIEHAVVPWCEVHEIAVVAYSPFGSGDFPSPRSEGGKALQAIAAARGATPRQVALAFLTRRNAVFAIPKSSKIAQIGPAIRDFWERQSEDFGRFLPQQTAAQRLIEPSRLVVRGEYPDQHCAESRGQERL